METKQFHINQNGFISEDEIVLHWSGLFQQFDMHKKVP